MSVIIPNKDHSVDLDLCIRSIIERATYKNLEFIVVENNSTEQETFAWITNARSDIRSASKSKFHKDFTS